MVTVDDLVAEPSLAVAPVHRAPGTAPTIRWVATSELPRPDDFLTGGELLLTTGMTERSATDWQVLVQRLVDLPLAALCFGTGLVHESVPPALVDAARAHDLTLLRSDVATPFVQISQWVIERQVALRERDALRLSEQQDELVRRLLDGGDLRGVLRGIHGTVGGGRLRVVEPDDTTLAAYPTARPWDGRAGAAGRLDLPILVRGRLVARLQSETPPADDRLARFAATVLGVELARRHAWQAGARERIGHVIEDALDRVVPDEQVRRRLARHGVRTDEDLWLAVGRVDVPPTVLVEVPGLVSPPGATRAEEATDPLPRTAMVRGRPTLLHDTSTSVEEAADELRRRLTRIDPGAAVGVSGPHRRVDGLRLGWLAADHASHDGPGVHRADRSSITWLLLAASGGACDVLVERVLAPLRHHDEHHGSDLVTTVRSHLHHDGVVAAVADELGIHPNTVRQRVRVVERLTGSSLTSTTTRVEFALALRALDLRQQ